MMFWTIHKIAFCITALAVVLIVVMGPAGLIAFRDGLTATKSARMYWITYAAVFWFALLGLSTQGALQAGLMFGVYTLY